MQWYLRRVHGDHSARMIRTLLIASLATLAAAEAEPKADADPYLVYGGYPYTHGLTYGAYNPYYTLPVVKAAEAEVKTADAEEKKTFVPLHYPINYGYYATHSPTTMARGRPSPLLMLTLMPRLTPGWHTVATLATPTPMATFPTTPPLWSPRRL